MEKFQKINSELFALNAIEPQKMNEIFGGADVTGGGSISLTLGQCVTGATYTSDSNYGGGNISYFGTTINSGDDTRGCYDIVNNTNQNFIAIQYGNPYGNPINSRPSLGNAFNILPTTKNAS